MKKKKVKLDKKDYMRAILTDTSPSDVPIIFSNDGLYINHYRVMKQVYQNFDILTSFYINLISPIDDKGLSEDNRKSKQYCQSYPMKYKIIKNENSLRTLSLIHPRSQKNYCLIYKDFADGILSHCSGKGYSIRLPYKVAGSFYIQDKEPINKYKEINIETIESDLKRKHASSFFSYKGFDRFYKFFNSRVYYNLEKNFSHMWVIDVANCFDTIYTHTISWAIKNKAYIKGYINKGQQFCQIIDTTMQRSNNNETNGIPIGSEFSRVFSEMIFQDIDADIQKSLRDRHGLNREVNYEIVRYVDDYVVFAKNKDIAKKVYEVIEDKLSFYNLYFNEKKIKKYERPFLTSKSKIALGVNDAVSSLVDTLFDKKSAESGKKIYPKQIFKQFNLEKSFIDRVKSIIETEKAGYSDVSHYIIGVLYIRVLNLLESFNSYSSKEKDDKDTAKNFKAVVILIIRIMFFFYNVSPSVASSEKLSRLIVIIDNFFEKNMVRYLSSCRAVIMSCVESLNLTESENEDRESYISLEKLNIIVATGSFGDNFAIPLSRLSFNHFDESEVNYFYVVCLLYYFKNNLEYVEAKKSLISVSIKKILDNGFSLERDAESVCLFLDILSCPYVDDSSKEFLLKEYLKKYEGSLNYNQEDLEVMIERLSGVYWFVKWVDLDLVKSLERKALKRPY